MKRERVPQLMAVSQVFRSSGAGQVSLYRGDAFQLPGEQWILSAFQGEISPTGGAWHGFWEASGRAGFSYPEDDDVPMRLIGVNQQLALLETNPRKKDGLPTLVLFGRGSRLYEYAQSHGNPDNWLEEVYFEALCQCRRLSREGRLGKRIVLPVLFSTIHNVSFERAIQVQRDFVLDLLRQEPSVSEVMISLFEESMESSFINAWHLAAGDSHVAVPATFPDWLKDGIRAQTERLEELVIHSHWMDEQLRRNTLVFLKRLQSEKLYLNNLAVFARNIVEVWATQHCKEAKLHKSSSLAAMVGHLRQRSGTPNRTIQYLESIRVLGNVGAHFQIAPHSLEPLDLLTLLNGLVAMFRLEQEFHSNQ